MNYSAMLLVRIVGVLLLSASATAHPPLGEYRRFGEARVPGPSELQRSLTSMSLRRSSTFDEHCDDRDFDMDESLFPHDLPPEEPEDMPPPDVHEEPHGEQPEPGDYMVDDGTGDFTQAKAYRIPRLGFVFKMGEKGLGF
jgi:hypothetical protein